MRRTIREYERTETWEPGESEGLDGIDDDREAEDDVEEDEREDGC